MKRCPQCQEEFDDNRIVCSHDGTELLALQPVSTDLLIGLTIDGKYRLERRIGRGGMGAVYIANHTRFNKQVAIKVLSPEMMEDPTAFQRFKREAEASARIKHPNAVPVTDFGQSETGIVYLVMEYIDGVSLRRLLERERRLLPVRAVEIGRQICAAIAAAHRANIIHRDLKPDNVMIEIIDGREVARVLDFGIAKLKDSQQQSRITKTDSVLGTPHYMSPEQCSGGVIDQRSDIYALGVMLYEMLSGTVPFEAQSAPAIIVQHVTKDPKPLLVAYPGVPEPLSRVIMRALEKQPDRRQQSAGDLAVQLEAALDLSASSPDAGEPIQTTVSQWQVLYHGMLDSSPAGRQRLIEGLQRSFGLPPAKAAQLVDGDRILSVKKTASQEEAQRVAERLRAIGADVKIEAIYAEIPPPVDNDADISNAKTEITPAKPSPESSTYRYQPDQLKQLDEKAKRKEAPTQADKPANIPLDPLVVMDGSEMLSYATERSKHSTNLGNQAEVTDPLPEPSRMTGPARATAGVGDNATKHIPTTAAESWSIDMNNGMVQDKMSDDDVEAWIRASRVRHNHKARKGNGPWQEVGQIPQFRRIIEEINPQSLQPFSAMEMVARQREEEHAGSIFLSRFIKLSLVVLFIYIVGSFTIQYSQRRLLEDELRMVLSDPKLTVLTLRGQVDKAVKQRGLEIPKEKVHITVDPPNRHIMIRIDYNRTILRIPLAYQAKREISNFNIPLDQLAQVPDGDLDIVGTSTADIERYRRDQASKRIAEKLSGYQGEPQTLKEREEVQKELQEFELAVTHFNVTSADETGRLVLPKSIKIREHDYSREAVDSRIVELRVKLGDIDRQIYEQRAKKQAEAESEANKSLRPAK